MSTRLPIDRQTSKTVFLSGWRNIKYPITEAIQFAENTLGLFNADFGPAVMKLDEKLLRLNSGREHIHKHAVFGTLDVHFQQMNRFMAK